MTKKITLFHVLYVPKLTCNLLSISQLTSDLKCEAKFGSSGCVLQEEESGKMIGKIEVKDGLYVLSTGEMDNKLSTEKDILLWHFRLGHPSFVYLERILPQLFRNKKATLPNCEVCQLAKHTRSTYSSIGYRPTKPFSVIHSDIWGPMRVKNLHNTRWFITFIDGHTRMTWTFLMKEKSETASLF
ncbi:Retrovirus-related Pol polyprotein from transposon RE2 [Linum perenne]